RSTTSGALSGSFMTRTSSFLVRGLALAKRLFACIGYLDPFRIRRGTRHIAVMPVPPLVGRRLRITLRRVFPALLPAERRQVEITPRGADRFIAAVVDEVRAEDPLAIAEEHVVAVPFVDAEVLVETVGQRVPRDHLPPHALLESRNVCLRRAGN